MDWEAFHAAIWRSSSASLRPVKHLDPVTFASLLGIDDQVERLRHNCDRFVQGLPSNHVLLWGSRGTGKSSLVKAVLNAYAARGLRVIEVDRDDMVDLPDIVDLVREQPYRFVIYCDDLSWQEGERGYRHLKSVLEGSIELPPENVRIMATSNRRHLIPQTHQDNAAGKVVDGELHLGDALEEKISLADRFGLSLSFYPINQDQYFAIIDQLFPDVGDRRVLHVRAQRFAAEKGGRSGRTAQQFFKQHSGEF